MSYSRKVQVKHRQDRVSNITIQVNFNDKTAENILKENKIKLFGHLLFIYQRQRKGSPGRSKRSKRRGIMILTLKSPGV